MKKLFYFSAAAVVLFSSCAKNKKERMYCECSKRKWTTYSQSVEIVNARPKDHQEACEALDGSHEENGVAYTLWNCNAITD